MVYGNESQGQLKAKKKWALKAIQRYKVKPIYLPLVNGVDETIDYLSEQIKYAETIYEIENIMQFAEFRRGSIKVAKELLYGDDVIRSIIRSKSTIELNNVLRGARLK